MSLLTKHTSKMVIFLLFNHSKPHSFTFWLDYLSIAKCLVWLWGRERENFNQTRNRIWISSTETNRFFHFTFNKNDRFVSFGDFLEFLWNCYIILFIRQKWIIESLIFRWSVERQDWGSGVGHEEIKEEMSAKYTTSNGTVTIRFIFERQ